MIWSIHCHLELTDWIPVLHSQPLKGKTGTYFLAISIFYSHLNSPHCWWFQVLGLTCCFVAAQVGRATNWNLKRSWMVKSRASLGSRILNNATGHAPGWYLPNRAWRQEAEDTAAFLRIMRKQAALDMYLFSWLSKQIPHHPSMIC